MTTTSEEFVEVQLVYAGERYGNKRCAAYYIAEKGKPKGDALWYAWTAKCGRRTVGGIYNGASVRGTTIRGLEGHLQYAGKIADRGMISTWEAEELAAQTTLAEFKLEKEDRRSEIERLLLPLRKEYAKHMEAYDSPKARALSQAVLAALQTKPRQSEL